MKEDTVKYARALKLLKKLASEKKYYALHITPDGLDESKQAALLYALKGLWRYGSENATDYSTEICSLEEKSKRYKKNHIFLFLHSTLVPDNMDELVQNIIDASPENLDAARSKLDEALASKRRSSGLECPSLEMKVKAKKQEKWDKNVSKYAHLVMTFQVAKRGECRNDHLEEGECIMTNYLNHEYDKLLHGENAYPHCDLTLEANPDNLKKGLKNIIEKIVGYKITPADVRNLRRRELDRKKLFVHASNTSLEKGNIDEVSCYAKDEKGYLYGEDCIVERTKNSGMLVYPFREGQKCVDGIFIDVKKRKVKKLELLKGVSCSERRDELYSLLDHLFSSNNDIVLEWGATKTEHKVLIAYVKGHPYPICAVDKNGCAKVGGNYDKTWSVSKKVLERETQQQKPLKIASQNWSVSPSRTM